MRVAVIGLGIGRGHVRAFKNLPDLFEVRSVCDLNADRARAVAEEHGVAHIAADLAELCAMPDLDVIALCTPSHLHVAQVKQILSAGKHVICEKPVAGSLKDMDDLSRAEQASGRLIMPIFQRRFGQGVQKLKLLQREGVTGRAYLATAETHWRRRAEYYATWHGKWRSEMGGVLVTLAIHAHDALSYVLGPARTVYANLATLVNPIETEDTAAISLEMADGSLAALSATTGSVAQITRLRFCFSNLSAESHTAAYSSDTEPWTFAGDSPEISQRIENTLSRFTPRPEAFEGQFTAFYESVTNGGTLPVTLADARNSVELITAIYHSARTHTPVTLPLHADHPLYGGWLP
jgi:predicted dehydrogenase